MGDRELPRAEDRLAPDRRLSLRYAKRPAASQPRGALVFLHGHYGLETDFLPLMEKLDPERRLHAYLPRGPLELSEGRADWVELNAPARVAAQLAPVVAWLDSLPFPRERVVLGGWSQGAAAACLLALAAGSARPAGLLCLGGTLPTHVIELDLAAPLPPVAIAHGTHDDAVPVAAARNARAVLELAGAEVLYLETGVGHELDQAVLPDLRTFVRQVGG